MADKRRVQVFTADCPVCDGAVKLVRSLACESCEVEVLDMRDPSVAQQAQAMGVNSVPAVAVDGRLATCCAGRGVTEEALRAAGIG